MEKNSIKLLAGLLIALAFLTGILASYALDSAYIDVESPYLISFGNLNEQPSDWISENSIEVYNDKIIIYVENAAISRYADSGSMYPTLGENANGIRIKPKSAEEIHIGDIVTFEDDGKLIVHRVIANGEDSLGNYFITKGDNNPEADGKVYFEDIKYVTIALIY